MPELFQDWMVTDPAFAGHCMRTFDRLYQSEWLLRIGEVKLVPGQTTLSLFAADYAGNESSRDFVLSVSD